MGGHRPTPHLRARARVRLLIILTRGGFALGDQSAEAEPAEPPPAPNTLAKVGWDASASRKQADKRENAERDKKPYGATTRMELASPTQAPHVKTVTEPTKKSSKIERFYNLGPYLFSVLWAFLRFSLSKVDFKSAKRILRGGGGFSVALDFLVRGDFSVENFWTLTEEEASDTSIEHMRAAFFVGGAFINKARVMERSDMCVLAMLTYADEEPSAAVYFTTCWGGYAKEPELLMVAVVPLDVIWELEDASNCDTLRYSARRQVRQLTNPDSTSKLFPREQSRHASHLAGGRGAQGGVQELQDRRLGAPQAAHWPRRGARRGRALPPRQRGGELAPRTLQGHRAGGGHPLPARRRATQRVHDSHQVRLGRAGEQGRLGGAEWAGGRGRRAGLASLSGERGSADRLHVKRVNPRLARPGRGDGVVEVALGGSERRCYYKGAAAARVRCRLRTSDTPGPDRHQLREAHARALARASQAHARRGVDRTRMTTE